MVLCLYDIPLVVPPYKKQKKPKRLKKDNPKIRIKWAQFGASKNHALNGCEKLDIYILYNNGFESGDGKLTALSVKIGRTVPWICRQAKNMGMTNHKRRFSENVCKETGRRFAELWKNRQHPRGMLGKKHTPEILIKMSEASRRNYARLTEEQRNARVMNLLKTRKERGTLISNRHKTTWKGGWREIGGKRMYLRSQWEEVYAKYLDEQKKAKHILEWEYEADTFWFEKIKRGCRSYTPDFKVTLTDLSVEYHEVKGWMDERSKTKLKRMRIYHPSVKMVLIDSATYKKMFGK